MATTVAGFADPNVILESSWAKIWGGSPIREQVQGFAVTPGPGPRGLSVAPGEAWLSGIYAEVDSITSLSCAANSSGQLRYDLVVVEAKWSTRAVSLKVVTGSPGSSAPSATRAVGDTWQGEIAVISVPNGATAFGAGDIKGVALRPVAPVYSIPVITGPTDEALPPVAWRAMVHAQSTGRLFVSNGTSYAELTVPAHTHPYQSKILSGTGAPPTSGVADGDVYIRYV